MRIGIDVDGVLADFNKTFIERVISVTGVDLFPARPFNIRTWNYPESYGYTKEQVDDVWQVIKADRLFWGSLEKYPTTLADLDCLTHRIIVEHDDVYFITARPGVEAKYQTEMWIQHRSLYGAATWIPTVLISSHKGLCAQALDLDIYIDDRWENVAQVNGMHWRNEKPRCKTFLMDRPWNQEYDAERNGIARVSSVTGMFRSRYWN